MAWQMNFTSPSQINISTSYWVASMINVCKLTQSGDITFLGFASKDAREANATPIGVKTYTVSPADFQAYFCPTVLQPQGMDPFKSAYSYSLSQLDTNGMSFFTSAVMV